MTYPSSLDLLKKEPFVGSFNAIYIRYNVNLVWTSKYRLGTMKKEELMIATK